jgi:hypothetical protein
MIKLAITEPSDPAWRTWRERCAQEQAALNAAMAAWLLSLDAPNAKTKPKVKADVYGAQKRRFYVMDGPPFWGKCAYCETRIHPGMHGDLDHFRPKAAVTNLDGSKVMVKIDGVLHPHPGYYWLTYDWTNLLPTCQLCNQPSTDARTGESIGKRDRFPIVGTYRACKPSEEEKEQPMLLNPAWDDPNDHLLLDRTGVMASKTERGRACIEVFGLNRRGLPDERATKYKETQRLLRGLHGLLQNAPNSEETRDELNRLARIKAGHEPHTMAARLAIRDFGIEEHSLIDTITGR